MTALRPRTGGRPAPLLPDRLWSTDPTLLAARHTDRSGWTPAGVPRAVARATSVQDVQTVLRACNALGQPVVVRGAGTGLAGGAAATDGCVVLDVSGLDRILEISAADGVAVVEPGVITADLDAAAGVHGLRYAPDPASVAISTVGGNIATNAGGLRCAKYGVTRDAVLGLDVVLADGELVSTGRRTVKGVAGYDLTGLFVGSEGTLGVVVGATLRLRPIPAGTATVAAWFASARDAVDGIAAVLAAGVEPAVAELLDGATLAAIADAGGGAAPGSPQSAFVLLQTDGRAAGAEAAVVEQVLRPLATSVQATADPDEAERLLAVRRAALPALERRGRVLIEDIGVPRSRLAAAVEGIAAISAETGVDIYTFAHAADGNLHPIVVVDHGPEIPDAAWRAADQLFRLALDLGGTITGEHGVGALKQRWLAAEVGGRSHDLQRRLRAVFDPQGILNPGKGI